MKVKVINKHKSMESESSTIVEVERNHNMIIEHLIEYNEDSVIITAAIKLDRNDPKCKKILKEMVDKQESPVVTIFKRIEKENRYDIKHQENATIERYINPIED